MVPVVRFGDRIVAGSAAIIDELERRIPDPPLHPADPELREEALGLQRHFDDVVGPLVRRSLFAWLIHEPAYVCRLFAFDRSAPVRFLYESTFPLVRGAAALLAPAADPPDSPMTKPRPVPESVRQWLGRWADHPGRRWVDSVYAKHRPSSAAILPDAA